jgi:hypothetical protein
MNVEVLLEQWGTYKKGDIIEDMPESTALACIANGAVKEAGSEVKTTKPKAKK